MGFAAFFDVPFECVRCGHRNDGDEGSLDLWILMGGPNVDVKPGDIIEETDLGIFLRDGFHQQLTTPLSNDGFSTLDEWSCPARLASGEPCAPSGIDDVNLVRLSFELVDQNPERIRFLSAEQVRFSSETVASVQVVGIDLKHFYLDEPTGLARAVLGPYLPDGEWKPVERDSPWPPRSG